MSYGFEIFSSAGALMFSTDSVSFFMIDVFEITLAGGGGSKTYNQLPANSSVVADWVSYDYSIDTSSAATILRNGFPWVQVSGKVLEWGWTDPSGNGYNTDHAIVRVFAA